MQTLIVVESARDWLRGRTEYNRLCGEGHEVEILALEPGIQAHLRRNDIPYRTTLDYFGRSGHERVLERSKVIMDAVRQGFDLRDEFGLTDGYRNLLVFHLRLYAHHLLFQAEVLSRYIEQHRPARILVPVRRFGSFMPPWQVTHERSLVEIAARVARAHGVPMQEYSVSYGVMDSLSAFCLRIGRAGLRLLSWFVIASGLVGARSRGRDIVLVTSRRYNLGVLVGRLRQGDMNFVPFFLNEPRLSAFKPYFGDSCPELALGTPWASGPREARRVFDYETGRVMSALGAQLERKQEELAYRGIPVTDLFVGYLDTIGRQLMRDLHIQTHALVKIMDITRPKAVLSQHALGWGYQLGELTARRQVPAVLISHGSHVPSESVPAAIEWEEHGRALTHTAYSYVAVQSPMADAYYTQRPTRSRLIRTGPLLFQARDRSEPERRALRAQLLPATATKFIVMHAGTPKGRESRRLYVYETADEYIHNINTLIRVVADLGPDYHLIVRFRELPDLRLADLQTLLERSDCYSVCASGSFDDYLAFTDLLVSYSSTTIDEALFNRIPVVLFDPEGRYKHIPAASDVTDTDEPADDVCFYVKTTTSLKKVIHQLHKCPVVRDGAGQDSWRRYRYPADLDGLRRVLRLGTATTG